MVSIPVTEVIRITVPLLVIGVPIRVRVPHGTLYPVPSVSLPFVYTKIAVSDMEPQSSPARNTNGDYF